MLDLESSTAFKHNINNVHGIKYHSSSQEIST
ncbi:unnamed protein product [Nezara viridula]|uniref:Uncharacterized protein n=1 Tax=Nezara viridula TaxID=85310 RepID=A0A9P0HFC3_NEZVI|nr:unnamed protein product [Nezara viridula]